MMIMNKTLVLAAVSLLLLASCNKEEFSLSQENDGNLQYVTVAINVAAGSLNPITGSLDPVTKSNLSGTQAQTEDIVCNAVFPEASVSFGTKAAQGIDDPTPVSDTKIKNLWVLQYDGTGNAAKLIGTPVYIEDYTLEYNRTAKLVASTSDNTIVFIANTFDKYLPFQQNSTIAELKQRRFTTQSLGTIVSKDPNTADTGTGTFPNDGDYYQRLNGYVEQPITEGSTLSCALGHNACRISINVTNKTAGTTYPVTLISADIENVPGCMYFFTDYAAYTSGDKIGKPTLEDLNHYGQKNYYDVITWTSEEGTSATTKSAKLYLSPNESGTVAANESPKLKSMFAPSRATILRIHGTYKDGANDIPVKYSFALGEDMIKNYQLVPNGDYVYDITLNARGDKSTDARVSYNSANGINYTEITKWPLSNCYICNPPALETVSNTYMIPVARVDQFWGGENYENVANNCLGENNSWTVSVIWSDMEVKAENFVITKATGAGKDDYFEVSIPGTTEMGNVVIGIKNTQSDDWLWSWHLWVTDYCPDEGNYLAQQGAFIAGTDTYYVTGGNVRRFQAAGSGSVQKVYMDRSIGAMSSDYVGSGKGVLYYQFGRKDPFPGNAAYWEGGTNKVTYSILTTPNTATGDNSPKNVPFSIKHPTTFITGKYWTAEDKYNPTPSIASILWQDPNASNLGGKSIFDPSPSGWKITDSVDGLTFAKRTNEYYTFSSALIPNGATIRFTNVGQRGYSNGAITISTDSWRWWASYTGLSNGLGYLHMAHSNRMYPSFEGGGYSERGMGYPIIPIQE